MPTLISFSPRPVIGFEGPVTVTTGGVVTLDSTKYIKQTGTNAGSLIMAKSAFITFEVASGGLRWTIDGSTPVTGAAPKLGHLAGDGDSLVIHGEAIRAFKVIGETGTGYIQVTYYN